jgi:Rha family phage regulatory protein
MDLNVINHGGKFLVDSREVSAMLGKQHNNLIRDIESYVAVMNQNSDLSSDNFFIESSYSSGTGRKYKCFLLTKQGCEMVANKMTGEKGILFTAAYVTKFSEMEHRQQNNVEVLDERKQRIVLMKTMIDHDERLDFVEDRIQAIENKVDEQITMDSGEQRKIQRMIAHRIYGITEDKQERSTLFRQLYREIKDRWAVPSYRDVRRNEVEGLKSYIEAWRPISA